MKTTFSPHTFAAHFHTSPIILFVCKSTSWFEVIHSVIRDDSLLFKDFNTLQIIWFYNIFLIYLLRYPYYHCCIRHRGNEHSWRTRKPHCPHSNKFRINSYNMHNVTMRNLDLLRWPADFQPHLSSVLQGYLHSSAVHSLQDNQSECGGHQSAADTGEPLPQQTGGRRSRSGQENGWAKHSHPKTEDNHLNNHFKKIRLCNWYCFRFYYRRLLFGTDGDWVWEAVWRLERWVSDGQRSVFPGMKWKRKANE